MNEMMYLQEANNKIICTNYFGKDLTKKRKFVVEKFRLNYKRLNYKITGVSLNGERLYVQLNNELVLVFKSFNILKNEIFKELENAIILPFIKYCLKCVGTNVNFHIHRVLDKNKPHTVSSILAIALASCLCMSQINTKEYKVNSQIMESNINDKLNNIAILAEEDSYEEPLVEKEIISRTIEDSIPEINTAGEYPESSVCYDTVTTEFLVADNRDFYSGEVYDDLVSVMNDSQKTAEMNNIIQEYIAQNLDGQMWANAENQGYNNYTIPEKYKNGEYTLNELFDDASATFGVPKDILVSISQHECGQGYYPLNTYTKVYEQNCGGMMGYLDVCNISLDHLPEGTTSGFDLRTNPAISIYSYASTVRFFYDSFKDIDVGYGLDSWDVSAAMIAIGPGHVSDIDVGFKYRQDYEDWGWSQLNICAPQFKALREAYLNNTLGVNDLTLTVENGVVTHWSDGEIFYYKNGEKTFNKMNDAVQTLSKNN